MAMRPLNKQVRMARRCTPRKLPRTVRTTSLRTCPNCIRTLSTSFSRSRTTQTASMSVQLRVRCVGMPMLSGKSCLCLVERHKCSMPVQLGIGSAHGRRSRLHDFGRESLRRFCLRIGYSTSSYCSRCAFVLLSVARALLLCFHLYLYVYSITYPSYLMPGCPGILSAMYSLVNTTDPDTRLSGP